MDNTCETTIFKILDTEDNDEDSERQCYSWESEMKCALWLPSLLNSERISRLWCKVGETRWRMVDSVNSGHVTSSLRRHRQIELARQSTGEVRTAERAPWRSIEVPLEYSTEDSVTHMKETSWAGLEGIRLVYVEPGSVLVSTNQDGESQESWDIR